MSWVRIDDKFFSNKKTLAVSKDAKLLYLSAICHAGAHLTNGFIHLKEVPVLAAQCEIKGASRLIKELVAESMWVPVEDGYQIHDYLEYNSSAEDVERERERARERMKGIRSKGKGNRPRTDSEPPQNNGEGAQDVRANIRGTSPEVPLMFNDSPTPIHTTTTSDEVVEPPKPPSSVDRRFAEFWEAYPKKVDKDRARKAFSRIRWSKVEFSTVMAALEQHKQSAQWTKDNGEFVPYPATWINNARWEAKLSPYSDTPSPKTSDRITSVDELFAQGADDEPARRTEDFRDSPTSLADERPRQGGDSGMDASAGRNGLRVIASRSG